MLKRKARLEEAVDMYESLLATVDDIDTLRELGEEADDEDTLLEAAGKITQTLKTLDRVEFERMFNGANDRNNAILMINSGAGGTESQDWARMLLRMYQHYAESKGWEFSVVDLLPGEEAGIKNATVMVGGDYAYGYLKAEIGVHRLVRISPFDSNARRHTSFASVFCEPEIDDDIDIEVAESDIRVDVYRAGGAGGQHVNTTDSAVRITHFPSGIVISCQNERSQHQNRAMAMKILKSRLYSLELEKRKSAEHDQYEQKKEIAWGSQIRSYVLHPYKMIKDLRTSHETSNTQAVLDGDLDPFIETFLRQMAHEGDTTPK